MKPTIPRMPIGRAQPRMKPTTNVVTPEKSLLERIEADLEEDGIELFNNDNVREDYLVLPMDITETPSQELGRYLNAFTQQKMWTRTLIGRVSAMAKETSKELDRIKDRVFATLPAKMAVKEKELSLANNVECMPLMDDLEFYRQKLAILSDYLENIVDAIFNISRDISRRSADISDEGRAHNTGNTRRGQGR